jgi:hypothetical protein
MIILSRYALAHAELWFEHHFIQDFTWWMGVVLLIWQPLPWQVVDEFKEMPDQITCRHTLQRFECLLLMDNNEPIRGLHPSLTDFLTNRTVCGDKPWFIDPMAIHSRLLARCFAIMKTKLTFNISRSTSSYLRNSEMPPQRFEISAALAYSCCFWADHLQVLMSAGSCSTDFQRDLQHFFHDYFLFWLEALSALNEVHISLAAIRAAISYLQVCSQDLCLDHV